MYRIIALGGLCSFLLLAGKTCWAQDQKRIIQLSGVILGKDSLSGLPGAHIYVPRSGRGTVSNPAGYFSLPILSTDSVVISSVGYERRSYTVPENASGQFVTIVVQMAPSVTRLEGIEIVPFPTEQAFKGAILALNVPSEEGLRLGVFGDEEYMRMMQNTPMGGYANYRYYLDQYWQYVDDRSRGRTSPFLNPFNWYFFFRDLKREKERKERERK